MCGGGGEEGGGKGEGGGGGQEPVVVFRGCVSTVYIYGLRPLKSNVARARTGGKYSRGFKKGCPNIRPPLS